MAERPTVNIVFNQKASTLIERSGEMPVVLMVNNTVTSDNTSATMEKTQVYTSLPDESEVYGFCSLINIDAGEEENKKIYNAVKLCFGSNPSKVIITTKTWGELVKYLEGEGITNFIVTEINEHSDKDSIINGCRSLAKNKRYGATAVFTDSSEQAEGVGASVRDTHYIALANESYVKYYEGENKLSEYEVNALYAGAVAACGVDRSLTNYTLPYVTKVEFAQNMTDEKIGNITKGGLVHAEMTAGKPRVVAGINSAEVGGDITEDMQYIEVIQTMDMICKDITDTFCEYYRGKSKNNYQRQLLFIGAVNKYFDDLAEEEILDNEYDNVSMINVDAQRNAWIAKGNSEAEEWSENIVKQRSFGRKVFLYANVKICQCMSDLEMYIALE